MVINFYYIRSKIASVFIIILLLSLQSITLAQTGSIKGKVFDKESKDALTGANVIINGTSLGAATDLDGNFLVHNIPVGNQTVVVSYIGYNSVSINVTITENRTLEQDFYLVPQALEGQTVTVTAQAQGQLEAINQQLTSDRISNVVSEARIQQLPDFNAAQALSRLPGISTTKSSGEDNKVVIRGLAPKYNAIEVDGIRLSATGSSDIGLTSDTYVYTPGVSNDRSVDLTMISPYMIRMLSVYKSLTPDMNANSIGGTVNMELREAPTGMHYNLSWQQSYTAKSGTYGNYRAVASGSDRFFDDNLGVYALFNAESYDRNADNLNAAYLIAGDESAANPETGYRPVKVSTVTFNRHIETRKRYGGNLIFDYRLPHGSLKFVNLLAQINSDYTDYNQTINYDNGRLEWRLQAAKNIIDQEMHSLKLDYDLGFLTADLSATYSGARNKLDNSPVLNFNQVSAVLIQDRDNLVPEDLSYLVHFGGDSSIILRSGNLFTNHYKEDKYTYKADFQAPFNIGGAVSGFFKFGGQYNRQSNSTDQGSPYLAFDGSALPSSGSGMVNNVMKEVANKFGLAYSVSGEFTGVSFLNSDNDLFNSFLDNKYGNLLFVSSPGLSKDIMSYIAGNPAFDASDPNLSNGRSGGWYNGPYQLLANDYNFNENYYAAYAMSKINFLDFMVIGGVRYEKVKSDYFAYNARDLRNVQTQQMYDTTSVTENEFVLPMVQVKYSPVDWMDIRYAYTQTLARPDYQSLSPKFTITQGNDIYAGNPELKPAKSFNHDVNITFHNNQIGLLTIGGFYKTVEDFVFTADYRLDAAQNAGIDSLQRYQVIRDGNIVLTPASASSTVHRPLNNPFDATIKGFEVDFQHSFWYLPSPFKNFILGVNYTRINSESKYPYYSIVLIPGSRPPQFNLFDSTYTGRLIDQPNYILNAWLGYDYEGFSTRLSFQYQDNSARVNGGEYPENDSYTKAYFRLDFSASQKLPWYNTEVFLNVNNLNNEKTSWAQKSTGGAEGIQPYGLTADLGLRIRY